MTQGGAERLAVGRVPDLGTPLSPRPPRPGGQDRLSVGGAGEQPNRPVVPAPRGVRNRLTDHLSGSEIPEPDRVVALARRDGDIPVGPEDHLLNPALVAQRLAQRLLAGDLPDLGGAVVTSGQDRPSVGAEGDGTNRPAVPQRCTPGSAAVDLPESGRPVQAGGDHVAAVGAEGRLHDAPLVAEGRARGSPVRASQSRAVPSRLAVTAVRPSGLKATKWTSSECRRRFVSCV